MKSQEQIRIDNLKIVYLTRHHRNCPFKSLGQILAFIYVYGGYTLMESVTVGDNIVYKWNKPLLTFIFDEEKQIPIFTFITQEDGNSYKWMAESQKTFLDNFNEITKPYDLGI